MFASRIGYEVVPCFSDSPAEVDSPVIVLLGSLGSERSMWNAQVEALSQEFRVVAVDLRGHGESDVPDGPYSVHGLTNDVIAVLDDLAVDRMHLVGLSLGGAIAQSLALEHPDRLDSLTLMCTAARFGDPANWHDRARTARESGTAALADTVVSRWITESGAAEHPEVVERLRAMVAGTPDEGYAGCCEALADFDVRSELSSISAPTLVIAGDQDPSTPAEVVQEIADGVPGARFELLPSAHIPAVEFPERVTELIGSHVRATVGG